MSLTSAGNLTVSNNLIVNQQTTLGGSLISTSSIQGTELISTGNISGQNLSITGNLTCPNSSLTCSNISSTGNISGQTINSLGNINGYGSLNLTGSSNSTTEIIQSGTIGTNVLGKTTFQGDVVINGNITANGNNGAYSLTDSENINMKGCIITQTYTDVSGNNNYTLQNTLLGTQFLGSITQTVNNGSTANSNSLQQTTFNGALTLLSNLIVNSISISPIILSYLNGLSSNLQTQLNNIVSTFSNYANLSSVNTFTDFNTFNNQLCISGNSQSVPSENFGLVVSSNYALGLQGTDFINTGYNISNGLFIPSFTFYQKTSSSTMNTLLTINGTGELDVNGVINTHNDFYINGSSIGNTYLTQANANTTYLNKTDASTIYLNKTDASNTYLTQANANTTYLNKTDATNTYLTQNSASLLYLTQFTATNTYLTTANASSTYALINSPSFSGVSTFIGTIKLGSLTSIPNIQMRGLPYYHQTPCGVWMIDNNQNWRPILSSIPDSQQTSTYLGSNGITSPATSIAFFTKQADAGYYLLPNYELIVYDNVNFSGSATLSVQNNGATPTLYAPIVNGAAQSWLVRYNGVQY